MADFLKGVKLRFAFASTTERLVKRFIFNVGQLRFGSIVGALLPFAESGAIRNTRRICTTALVQQRYAGQHLG